MDGFVSLVGAGPGDPELLTVRALRRLAVADLVLHDALVPQTIVALAATAEKRRVGRRVGQRCKQRSTEQWMISAARSGRRVVRLKCGDPFVLGRGGEEALVLKAAGVPFEVVPGLSAAIAAPASVGIPLTQRGLCSGFAVVSGHCKATLCAALQGLRPEARLTVIVLMGLANRRSIAGLLLHLGWPARTPAAVILGATTGAAEHWTGRLDELGSVDPQQIAPGQPGTIVVGETAGLSLTDAKRTKTAPRGNARATWAEVHA